MVKNRVQFAAIFSNSNQSRIRVLNLRIINPIFFWEEIITIVQLHKVHKRIKINMRYQFNWVRQ